MNSNDLFLRSQKVAPGGVHSPVRSFSGVGGQPLFFKAAEGAYMESVEGKKYIDFCQSFGPNILGHRDPDVQEEVEKAIKEAWSFGACEPYSLELAEWICNEVLVLDKLRFVNSGTEAVMSALRIARAATGRSKILKFEGCYHGHVDSMLVKAGSGLAGLAASDSAGVSQAQAEETIVCPLNDVENLNQLFTEFGNEIAAVIFEPLPANFGLLPQTTEFVDAIFDNAKKAGSLVIFDEVISGFRIGMGGMAEYWDVKPDLVTYGKVVGGGFPIGAYGGRADLMDMVAPAGPVYQAGTLAANPIGCRAGLATLKKIKQLNLHAELEEKTKRFAENLEAGFQSKGLKLKVAHFSSLFWIYEDVGETIRSPSQFSPTQKDNFKQLFLGALERGVYLAPSAFEVGFVSAAHTDEILDQAAMAIIEAAVEA